MSAPKNILVAVDFSATSDQALAYAKALAEPFGASLHLLHVILDPHSQAWSIEATGIDLPSVVATWESEATERLGQIDVGGLTATRVTKVGQPFVEIVKYAKQNDIHLIIMGTHGRGAIEHMLLGSVAEKVVRKAPCPVLTVRDPGHKFTQP